MYTDNENENLYEEDDYGTVSTWDNSKGLIFKIIIIILCVIVLIWLIRALKNNRNQSDNGEIHVANVEKVRLAAEDYFFIKNMKDKYDFVSLAGLQDAGLIKEVVDANNKVCNEHSSKVNLNDDVDTLKMTVSLSCSTKDKDEVFYYHKNTLACLNCNGKTNMTGKETIVAKAEDSVVNDGGNKNVSDDISNNNDEYNYYSCIDWSDWSKTRVYDSSLTERSKTLVQGVKYGTSKTYSDWSEYSTTPIVGNDTIEVETKVVTENVWSDNKTGTDINPNNSNIKVISKETIRESNKESYCKDGFMDNNICYSNKTKVGNLSMEEFTSGKYKIKNNRCERVKTMMNSEGRYVLTYVNCEYNEKIETSKKSGRSYTLYTYQVLETKDVTYYRYRTINTIEEPDKYTDGKYEEEFLPDGYVKVPGSEEVYYSYKLAECVK